MNDPKKIVSEIKKTLEGVPRQTIMEVCGTHTQTIAKYGIREALEDTLTLVSGPGCPVCVTPQKDLDNIIELALNGVKIATYGDMLKLTGSRMRLDEARAKGADVKVIYSVDEIIGTDYVFLAAGFETTAPMTAYALENGVSVYSVHKLVPPVLEAVTSSDEINVGGFINPGHVSVIIGSGAYCNIKMPQVIAGFERDDVLLSILMLARQIKNGEARIENEYSRAVT